MLTMESPHNVKRGRSWLKCQETMWTTMQRKRRERGSTGVVGNWPGASEYVISNPCGWIQPTYNREALPHFYFHKYILWHNARSLKVTVPGKMLKMNRICTQHLMWTAKPGLKSLQTVSEDSMGKQLNPCWTIPSQTPDKICSCDKQFALIFERCVQSWWDVALFRAIIGAPPVFFSYASSSTLYPRQ